MIKNFKIQVECFICTVELWWLKLVGTVGVSSTNRWVSGIPGLTIFKGVHMYFMFTMDTMHATSVMYVNLPLCTNSYNYKRHLFAIFICGKWIPWSAWAYAQADQCICYQICYHDIVVWLPCEWWHTNSRGCLKQRLGSDCTPTQSDAHLNPVSTRCLAIIGPPVKRHSNVVALAGRSQPAFRC